MYRIVKHVFDAVDSARDFLMMWFHMLIVISALTTVLLHGQFSTVEKDYAIDSQFKAFFHSISTITIYLIGVLIQTSLQLLSMGVCSGRGQLRRRCPASP